jgi:hypothetical protein
MNKMNQLSQEKPAPSMVTENPVASNRLPGLPAAPAPNETILMRKPALTPSSMTEAMQLAEMMARSKLVPKDLQKSASDCLMVIMQAVRWDMDPFAVAQECSVIQGKLMHSGKLVAAVVNARGNLSQRLSYQYTGHGDDRTISVRGTMAGESTPREVSVILRNAKTSNSMWIKQPDQQLMYHGARVWARRHTPELMLGVYSPEEFEPAQTAITADGWPAGALSDESEYAGGIPEKQSKDLRPINQSRKLYSELRQEIEALIETGISPREFDHWGTVNAKRCEPLAGEWFDEMNRFWLEATGRVHDNWAAAHGELQMDDEPEPEPDPPESGTISQRAIALMVPLK